MSQIKNVKNGFLLYKLIFDLVVQAGLNSWFQSEGIINGVRYSTIALKILSHSQFESVIVKLSIKIFSKEQLQIDLSKEKESLK